MQVVRYGLPGGLPGLARGPRSTNCAYRTARRSACHGVGPRPGARGMPRDRHPASGIKSRGPSAPPQGPGCAGVVARGYCGLLISPIEVLTGAGTPPIWPPFASERPLIGRSSLNSWGNFVWVQGPRRSAPSPLTEALCSPCPVRGARGLDLGPWPFVLDR